MHEITGEHWHEPEGMKNAGYGAWKRPNTPYDDYMEAQGIPIFRGIGVKRVQDMPLKRWNRMGGNGTFIQLYGTEGRWGCYVVEVPGAGALNPERHMYEEIMAPPRCGPTTRRSPTLSSGSAARCSRSRSTPGTASSMRRRAPR
jgi:hypothetical protein